MKKYQVTWGWNPPQYDRPKGNFRLFFHTEEVEREVTHKDFETGEETTEIIHEWLCDVVEYDKSEAAEILRLIKENKNSLECKRWVLKERIKAYDKSRHVEDFTIGEVHLWLDSHMRAKVREALETSKVRGEEYTTLRFNGMEFTMKTEDGWKMYFAVLGYARASWDNTQSHLAMADKLETVEDIDNYDFTADYPPKLAF